MQEHGPASYWEMRHAQTGLATHQHSPHRHTQGHQTAHTDTPSDKNTTCAGTRLRGTRGVPAQGKTQQESDRHTRAHPDATRVSLRENAAAGHSQGCAWHPCHPPPLWPGTGLSAPLLPVLRASSLSLPCSGSLWVHLSVSICLPLSLFFPPTCLCFFPPLLSPSLRISGSLCPFVFPFSLWLALCLCLPGPLCLYVSLGISVSVSNFVSLSVFLFHPLSVAASLPLCSSVFIVICVFSVSFSVSVSLGLSVLVSASVSVSWSLAQLGTALPPAVPPSPT